MNDDAIEQRGIKMNIFFAPQAAGNKTPDPGLLCKQDQFDLQILLHIVYKI
jgi:hypothetical protein